MHAIAVRALRPAIRLPARFVAGRRHCPRFHTAAPSCLPRRPSPFESADEQLKAAIDQAEQNESATEKSEESAKGAKNSKAVAQGGGGHDGHDESSRRIAETLELRGSRQDRQQQRFTRPPEVRIPKWFQSRNVKLAEESLDHKPRASYACALSVRSKDTNDVLATIAVPSTQADAVRTFENVSTRIFGQEASKEDATEENKDRQGVTEKDGAKELQKSIQPTEAGYSPDFWIEAEIKARIAASLSSAHSSDYLSFPAARSNLVLHTPVAGGVGFLSDLIKDIATTVNADVIQLNAQDVAELGADYLQELDPMRHSIRTLGYDTYQTSQPLSSQDIHEEQDEEDENEDDATPLPTAFSPPIIAIEELRPRGKGGLPPFDISNLARGLRESLSKVAAQLNDPSQSGGKARQLLESPTQASDFMTPRAARRQDLYLSYLLAALTNANELKRAQSTPGPKRSKSKGPEFFSDSSPSEVREVTTDLQTPLVGQNEGKTTTGLKMSPLRDAPRALTGDQQDRKTIILVQDFKEMMNIDTGRWVLNKLADIVIERRKTGDNIMIVGVTSDADMVPSLDIDGIKQLQTEQEDSTFRTILLPRPVNRDFDLRRVIEGQLAQFRSLRTTLKPLAHDDGIQALINSERAGAGDTTQMLDLDAASSETHLRAQQAPGRLDTASTQQDVTNSDRESALRFWLDGGIDEALAQYGIDGEIDGATGPYPDDAWGSAETRRIVEVNQRHMCDMLRRIDPSTTDAAHDLRSQSLSTYLSASNEHILRKRVLAHEEVHHICMLALGLRPATKGSSAVKLAHQINLAMGIMQYSDATKYAFHHTEEFIAKYDKWADKTETSGTTHAPTQQELQDTSDRKLAKLKKTCNDHEKKLLGGVIDRNSIRTTFDDVHATQESIEALKTLTSLSFLRPDAFKYGVLATDKIPGLLLYGPPGTGKTLLAKAVARDSGATMLEVSASEVNDMYVGEGEKNVKAVFSLARKLSPCVVFIDEADALFRSRGGPNAQRAHREVINQFLKEWDGMNDLGVFIMVATNRPFDLDDAVLRRLPRRLLVDLPTEKDRRAILDIHLKGETLAADVSTSGLAARTPFYSGSDLKNMCVAAALACVRGENEAAKRAEEAKEEYKYPEKRELAIKHFDKALLEISASISEDMATLNAIKKFDEQYGDKKGRRKKSGYGFMPAGMKAPMEELARVRI